MSDRQPSDAYAREQVAVVAAKLEAHEQHCSERYRFIMDMLKTIFKLGWSVGGAVIFLLVSIIGFLIATGPPWFRS